jgi:NTE family protein
VPFRPDVLVLGGGGVLGEAWMMGVLSGIEDASRIDFRHCEYYVGTSAGSIVAAHLVAGQSPRRPKEVPDPPRPATREAERRLAGAGLTAARRAGEWALATAAAFAPLAVGLAAPGGALVRGLMLRRLPRPTEDLDGLRRYIATLGARFDGRLRVAAVDRNSGRRVVFGSPRAPGANVADAVAASCTVPWLFSPVEIGGREYVDGGVWSPTNMDAAPAGRGSQVLCLNPTASLSGSADIIGVFRRASRVAAGAETMVLRRRGATVRVIGPSADVASVMGVNLMDRARSQDTVRAGYLQGIELASRLA